MAQVTTGYSWSSGNTVTAALLNQSVNSATVTNIVNADISASAAIAASKLNLAGAINDSMLATGAVTGAAGGGKLAASAITGQTTLADPLASGDEFLVHDASAAALRRVAWSAIRPSNSPLQIVQAVKTDTQTIDTGVSDWVDVAGLSLTLTRAIASASGKVRVQASILTSDTSGNGAAFRIVRGSTEIGLGAAAGSRIRTTVQAGNQSNNNSMANVAIDFIDSSPGATATVTYKIQARVYSLGLAYINRSAYDDDLGDYIYRGISTLTLTELAP